MICFMTNVDTGRIHVRMIAPKPFGINDGIEGAIYRNRRHMHSISYPHLTLIVTTDLNHHGDVRAFAGPFNSIRYPPSPIHVRRWSAHRKELNDRKFLSNNITPDDAKIARH
jgi:hypothetical protein